LTSQWKSGKSTLVALLLARMQQGGQLLGLPVSAGKAFVISEESEADWRPRFHHLGIRDHVDLLCRPFLTQPTMEQWLALIETAATLRQRHGTDLVVFDSLSHFLPAHCETTADALKESLAALLPLMNDGMSVLLPHHPRKGKTLAGQAARGSGVLPAFVNILIEMGYYSQPDDLDRRRRLVAFSRHDETPRHLLVEFVPDGSDYVVLQTGLEAAFGDNWQAVLHVLGAACTKQTRQEILEDWPADYDKPEPITLWRWLSRAVAQGIVRQDGTGRSRDPYRYWLPSREALIRPDGGTKEELHAWNARVMAEAWERLVQGDDPEGTEAAPSQDAERPPPDCTAAPLAEVAAPVPEPTPSPQPAPERPPAPPPPAPPADTVLPPTPEEPVRLPFPFGLLNPAEVPEWVWQQARKAQRKD
jgi:hypothetical protein